MPDRAVSFQGSYAELAGPGTGATKPLDWAEFSVVSHALIGGVLLLRVCTALETGSAQNNR